MTWISEGQSTNITSCLFSLSLHLAASPPQAGSDSTPISYTQHHCNWYPKAESNKSTSAHKLPEIVHWCESKPQLFWRALVGLWRHSDLPWGPHLRWLLPVCMIQLGMYEPGFASLRLHPCFITYQSMLRQSVFSCGEPWAPWRQSPSNIHFCSPPQEAWGLVLMSHSRVGVTIVNTEQSFLFLSGSLTFVFEEVHLMWTLTVTEREWTLHYFCHKAWLE